MCASYNPPTENITSFNSSLFNQPEETLSQAEADQLYLSKTKADTSTAPNTDFNGAVTIKGTQNFGVQNVAGGITNINRRLRFNDINGNATGYGDMLYGSGPELLITSYSLASTLLSTFIRFQTCPAGSTTPVLKLEVGDTTTKVTNNLNVTGSSTLTGDVSVGDATTSSGWLNIRFRTRIYDINNPYTNFTQLYMIGNNEFVIGPNAIGDKVSVYVKNSIGAQLQKLEISDATTKILNSLEVGTAGSSYSATFKNGIALNDINSPYTNYSSFSPQGFTQNYTMYAGTTTATRHIFYTYNNANTSSSTLAINNASVDVLPKLNLSGGVFFNDTGSYCNMYITGNIMSYTAYAGTTTSTSHRFFTYNNANVGSNSLEITSAGVTVTPNLNLGNRLVYNASSYSFPLASQQTQGYYLKTAGTALATPTYVSNTYISCVTSPTIAIGVWRIDYSVTNTISVGGNITATDTLVSTTINNSTPVSFTGSQQITHTTENYSAGDKHIVTGSFTYNQSTAGVLYLTINRVFASGSYSWVGELAVTRIA